MMNFFLFLSMIKSGFGNVTPKTDHGKVATILYTIIGIPLMIPYLSVIGKLLANLFKTIHGKICPYLYPYFGESFLTLFSTS